MPSLIRLLIIIGVLAGIAYGAMFALTILVEPREREVSVRLPNGQIELRRVPAVEPLPLADEPDGSDQ